MRQYIVFLLSLSIFCFLGIHIIDSMYSVAFLQDILSFFGLLILVFCFMLLRHRTWVFPALLCLLSFLILLFHGDVLAAFWSGFREMRQLIALVILIPLLGWIIKYEPYIPALLYFTKRFMSQSRRIYFILILIMAISTFFFSLGSIFLMFTLTTTLLAKQDAYWNREKDIIIIQGFSLAALWSVAEPSMIFALEATNAPVFTTLGFGFGLSLLGMILGLFFSRYRLRQSDTQFHVQALSSTFSGTEKEGSRLNMEFLFLLIGFFLTILFFYSGLTMNIINVIPLTILIWTVIYFIYKTDVVSLARLVKEYAWEGMVVKSRELSFIMAAGFMIVSSKHTGWGNWLFTQLIDYSNQGVFIDFFAILPLVIVLLGFIGMTPTTSMVLITAILAETSHAFSPVVLVLTLMTGVVLSFLISPVTMPGLVLSSLNKRTPFQNGIQLNWTFAILFYLIAQSYIRVVDWMI